MRMSVRITPNARRDEVAGRTADGAYRVKVQSPPVEGAANRRLLRYLAERLGISKSHIKIVGGSTSRNKVLEIEGDEQEIIRRMEGSVHDDNS
jgi:uncharacterized protein